VKDQELNPRPHTPRPAALPVKVEQWVVPHTFFHPGWLLGCLGLSRQFSLFIRIPSLCGKVDLLPTILCGKVDLLPTILCGKVDLLPIALKTSAVAIAHKTQHSLATNMHTLLQAGRPEGFGPALLPPLDLVGHLPLPGRTHRQGDRPRVCAPLHPAACR